ncbi:DUF4290 domain-containing protein [Pseudarcicella hirudinis]|uniref:DUF4290 domain-containing protein n=1 Tax=Pseudarcicella hirudinis TaxID=1079859 RepID=UPI0035ECAC19
MKEYGTNVQKLVDHILTIQDRDKRTKYAYLLIELMKQVHPNMRDNQDYSNKLWDDLFILSNFQLDVDSPYPPPSPDAVGKRPKSVPYNVHQLKFRHYGRNVELLILRAIAESNPEDKKLLVAHIGKLMKTFYQTWNKEVVDDAVIWEHMREMSENLLAKRLKKWQGLQTSDTRAILPVRIPTAMIARTKEAEVVVSEEIITTGTTIVITIITTTGIIVTIITTTETAIIITTETITEDADNCSLTRYGII